MTKRTEYGAVGCVANLAVHRFSVSSYLSGNYVLSVFDRTYLCLFRKFYRIENYLNLSGLKLVSDFRKGSSEMQKESFSITVKPGKGEFWNKRGVLELSVPLPGVRNSVLRFLVPYWDHVLSVFDRTYLCLFRIFHGFCKDLDSSALNLYLKFQKESSGIQKGSSAITRNPAKREFYNKRGVLKSFIQLWQRKRTRKG